MGLAMVQQRGLNTFSCKTWKLFFLVGLLGCCFSSREKFGAVVTEILRGRGLADRLMPWPRARFHLLYSVSDVRFSRDLENVRSFWMLIFLS